jgi:PIN domain nuclease of toxin-antitoxin system
VETVIYLDTHVLVWLYEKRLDLFTSRAKQLIDTEPLFLSPMVILEMDYLHESKRIVVSSRRILGYLQKKLGLTICNKPFPEIINSARVLSWTRDPFDRLIVGHARLDENRLLSKDEQIRQHYRHAVW